MKSITLFNLDNWRNFSSISFSSPEEQKTLLRDEIEIQNSKGFIVAYEQYDNEQENVIELYKKHSTSILKSIIIGKVSLLDFADLKQSVDTLENQTHLIQLEFEKPEFSKYSAQRKVYFPES